MIESDYCTLKMLVINLLCINFLITFRICPTPKLYHNITIRFQGFTMSSFGFIVIEIDKNKSSFF